MMKYAVGCVLLCSFVFCFKQKTAYEMRISDWSSDVCSSDLPDVGRLGEVLALVAAGVRARDLEFEVIDALRLRRSVALPRRGEQLFDIGLIFGANRRHLRVGRQIIFALGRPEAALQHIGDDLARGREPLRHEDAEEIFGAEVGRVERVDVGAGLFAQNLRQRSEEHTSELQSLMRISYAVFCLKKNKTQTY